MKKLIFILLLLTNTLSGQKLEILLIGSSHDYSVCPPQDFASVHQKIKQFKPDAFFGEYRLPEEEKVLMDYWAIRTLKWRVLPVNGCLVR